MIPDYREETCTYLMLKLKVALKKTSGAYSFLGTSTQVKTIKGGFEKSKYLVSVEEHDENDTFLITLTPK